jgi:hypothetical protein
MRSADHIPTLTEIGKPYCAKCGNGKIVDEMEILRRRTLMTYEFVVRCHGEEDRCELSAEAICFHFGNIERGFAFLPKPGLPEPQKRLTDGDA